MKERAAELRAEAKRAKSADKAAADLADVRSKIDEMVPADREIAEGLHALVASIAPGLAPRAWYGMPAYALDGAVVLFFQSGAKFKSRYCTIGFNDCASLDDGVMWPTGFAVTGWDESVRGRVAELISRAVRS